YVETLAARSRMLWAKTFSRTSACWLGQAREATDAPSRRLVRLKALSACHRWPYTRLCRLPRGFLRNRRTICRRERGPGPLRAPRPLRAVTVDRPPDCSRQVPV